MNRIKVMAVADTTGGVKLDLPDAVSRLIILPDDSSEVLSIKFSENGEWLAVPAGFAWDSGNSKIAIHASEVYAKMADGSAIQVEYWT